METNIKRFNDLEAWKKGHVLVIDVYKVTKVFPREEIYGIVSQLRRAASSITANIAEGFDRYHFNDKIRFYYQARGSVGEVQNFLFLANDLKLINQVIFSKLIEKTDEIRKLINGLIKSIEKQK